MHNYTLPSAKAVQRTSGYLLEAQFHSLFVFFFCKIFFRYTDTCEVFAKEAHLSTDIEVCDNIDLETILLEYSDYYFAKFNKYPKICKKGESNFTNVAWVPTHIIFSYCEKKNPYSIAKKKCYILRSNKKEKNKVINRSNRKFDEESIKNANDNLDNSGDKIKNNLSKVEPNFNITVTPLFPTINSTSDQDKTNNDVDEDFGCNKSLKPLGKLYASGTEWREIAEMIAKVP